MKLQKKKASTELSLPNDFTMPSTVLGDYSILLYGEKKIGKTSLCSMFPSNLFMFFETGGKALKHKGRFVNNWEEFKQYNKLIRKDKSFKTVTIDPVDLMYKDCVKYVCKKLMIDHPSEEEWGKGWEAVRDEFTTEINYLLASGKGVIFISHATDKEIKTRTGEKYHRISPTMASQAREILEGVVDIWAYFCYEKGDRVLVIEGDDHVGAGHRLESQFKHTDGTSVKLVPMGKDKNEAYQNFIKAFNNQLPNQGGKTNEVKKKFIVKKLKTAK